MTRSFAILALALVALAARGAAAEGADWTRFRGPNGSGISEGAKLPEALDPKKNLAWKIDAPAGVSSPVIAGEKVFITSFNDDDRTVHCLSSADGSEQWARIVKKAYDQTFSEPNCPAGSTAVTDGKQVFVLFPDAGLFAFSSEGEPQWRVDLGNFESMRGVASSPILVGGRVIVVLDVTGDSFIAAFDAATGKEAWRQPRASGVSGAYATPAVRQSAGGPAEIIAPGPMDLPAYSAATGERLWWISGRTKEATSIPVIAGDRLFVCEPASKPPSMNSIIAIDGNKDGHIMLAEAKGGVAVLLSNVDKRWGNNDGEVTEDEWFAANASGGDCGGLTAVRLGGSGDLTATNIEWNYRRSAPLVPSVLAYRDVLYLLPGGGILVALDPKDGKILKRGRIDGAGSEFIASPVAGDGKIYVVSDDGVASVIRAGAEWEAISSHSLDEPCYATPAIASGKVYIRTKQKLWCFGAAAQ